MLFGLRSTQDGTADAVAEEFMNKREFLKLSGVGGIVAAVSRQGVDARRLAQNALVDVTGNAVPIDVDERLARVEKAQRLMRQAGVHALLLEAGSTLVYFTGVQWGRSERFTGALIPAEGDMALVTPYFEEPSIRERMTFGNDVRTWHEHENPFDLVAGILADRGISSGKIGVEETVRHFIVDGVQKAAPRLDVVSGAEIARGCRMYKSAAEIALMQTANDVTMAAYRHVYARIEKAMRPADIAALMNETTRSLGGNPRVGCLLHSGNPKMLRSPSRPAPALSQPGHGPAPTTEETPALLLGRPSGGLWMQRGRLVSEDHCTPMAPRVCRKPGPQQVGVT